MFLLALGWGIFTLPGERIFESFFARGALDQLNVLRHCGIKVINLTIADLLLGVAAVLLPILEPRILESHNILGEHFNWYE